MRINPSPGRPSIRWAAALIAISTMTPARGQSAQMPSETLEDELHTAAGDAKASSTVEKPSKPDLVIVPIPLSSPTLGSGLILTAMLFYNPNNSKEPWTTGIGAMKTSNGSLAVGALHRMAIDQDRFRVAFFGGLGDVNIRFYGTGSHAGSRDRSVELNERGFLAAIQGQARVAGDVYLGARALHLSVKTSVSKENSLFPEAGLPRHEFRSKLSKLGPVLTYDRRDSSLYPRNGEEADIVWLFSIKGAGSDFSYNKLTIDANIFRSLSKNTVIAGRAAVCAASSGAPFYDLCFYGASSDLRGYESGRYRDRATWAGQLELRQHLFARFGAVAFAGIGGSAPKWSDIDKGKFLPSAGVGLRFRASKTTPINLRVDYALGRDSSALYIGIGEAF